MMDQLIRILRIISCRGRSNRRSKLSVRSSLDMSGPKQSLSLTRIVPCDPRQESGHDKDVPVAILDAVKENREEDVRAFLESTRGILHRKERRVVDSIGWGLVHVAVENGHLNLLKLLVEEGLDASACCKPSYVPPLAIAVCSGNAEVTAYLCSIPSVLEHAASYKVKFILSDAASGSMDYPSTISVRRSVQRRVMRCGQRFSKPILLWQAAMLVGGMLEDSGESNPFEVARILQCTRTPGLAMFASRADDSLPLTPFIRASYLKLLLDSKPEATGLPTSVLYSALKDLLEIHMRTYTSHAKSSIPLSQVQSSLLIVLELMFSSADFSVDYVSLVQDIVFPPEEEEVLCVSREEDREAYSKKMIEYKIWMLKTLEEHTAASLVDIQLCVPVENSSQLRLSISNTSILGPREKKQGLYHCIALHAPVRQVASADFWAQLTKIFGVDVESFEAPPDSQLTVVERVKLRQTKFSHSQAAESETLQEAVRILEGFDAVEKLFKELFDKVNFTEGFC